MCFLERYQGEISPEACQGSGTSWDGVPESESTGAAVGHALDSGEYGGVCSEDAQAT